MVAFDGIFNEFQGISNMRAALQKRNLVNELNTKQQCTFEGNKKQQQQQEKKKVFDQRTGISK